MVTELMPLVRASQGEKLSLRLMATVEHRRGRVILDIPATAGLVLEGRHTQLAVLRVAAREHAPVISALEDLLSRSRSKPLIAFAVIVDVRAVAAEDRRSRASLRAHALLEDCDDVLRSPPIPAWVQLEMAEDEIEPGALEQFAILGFCPPWSCHSHWHGDWTEPASWWTQCHGPCLTTQCRCNRTPRNPQGAAICWGWTTCQC